MTIRELILILEKHSPETVLLFLGPDYASGSWYEIDEVEEAYGEEPAEESCIGRDWDVSDKEIRPGLVKVLLLH
jgi:hypothetical protein